MGTFGRQIMTVDMACRSQNFVTPEINFGHLAPYPWGSAEAGTKVGDATQDPPDPAAPRCAPEPELTCALLAAGCWLLLLAVGGLAAGELQPRRWPTVGRFQPWAAASEQAEGSGWTKGNTEKEEGNNTTTLH